MTNDMSAPGGYQHECIEPGLGEQIWRVDDPTTSPGLRSEIELHLRHCAACRLRSSLERDVADGLRDGRLSVSAPTAIRPSWARWTTGAGAAALAACLALIFLLPPRGAVDDMLLRGADDVAVTAPRPDEVVLDRTPAIRWTALERANSYRVTVRDVDGDYAWTGETTDTELSIPDSDPLPSSARLRIEVVPTPAVAAPDGGLRSSFRSGSMGEFLGFRAERSHPGVKLGALLGGLALLIGGIAAIRQRG